MVFIINEIDGRARAGQIFTDHGIIHTPAFMPVGTQGSVKAMSSRDLNEIGSEIILGNTYHLFLRPGGEILSKSNGLHKFMGWDRPILTDSGGYQIYSLAPLRKTSEEGVQFRSHVDGSLNFFTAESVIDFQRIIGSDIMMVLDDCAKYPCPIDYAKKSNELTIRWAKRSFDKFNETRNLYNHSQSIFGIIQGSIYHEIRTLSINALTQIDFHGFAIGGLAVGEPTEIMYDIVSLCDGLLPFDKPRYLMGVGTPENLLESIERGVDIFDCVLPTRNGRNAMLFTSKGALTITNARFKDDFEPIDNECNCYTCRNYSRAYLRHLFQAKELLGLHLATLHNLYFYHTLMRQARVAIINQKFSSWKQEKLIALSQGIENINITY